MDYEEFKELEHIKAELVAIRGFIEDLDDRYTRPRRLFDDIMAWVRPVPVYDVAFLKMLVRLYVRLDSIDNRLFQLQYVEGEKIRLPKNR